MAPVLESESNKSKEKGENKLERVRGGRKEGEPREKAKKREEST